MTVVVLGGNSLVVSYLLARLVRADIGGLVVARRPVAAPDGFAFLDLDVSSDAAWTAPDGAVVISLLPLPVLAQVLGRLAGADTIVAIGSTSRFSKGRSSDPRERTAARALEEAEGALATFCETAGVRYTILRPTLVYDGVGDRNVARMARFVRRYRTLFVARPGSGLRQPIHADDVAGAIVGAIRNDSARNRAFNIAGGEILTYREMAERVFMAQGLKPRLVMLPMRWLRLGFRLAESCGLTRQPGFGAGVFERMNQDLVFDIAEGLDVLGYRPRRFEPGAAGPPPACDPTARSA